MDFEDQQCSHAVELFAADALVLTFQSTTKSASYPSLFCFNLSAVPAIGTCRKAPYGHSKAYEESRTTYLIYHFLGKEQ